MIEQRLKEIEKELQLLKQANSRAPKFGIGGGDKAILIQTIGTHAVGATQSCVVLTGSKGLETDSGDREDVYNRFNDLDDQETALAAKVNGQYEIVELESAEIVEGFLDAALTGTQGESVSLSVWAVDQTTGWSDTGTNVLLFNRGGFVASAGVYVVAFKVYEPTAPFDNAYRPIMIGCA